MARLTTMRRAGVIAALIVGGVLIASGYLVDAALAAPVVPAPTITSSPSSPTTSTTAAFRFTDTRAGVTFKCSLDAGAFTACTSGISYAGLARGNHTFQVEAVSGTSTSSATSTAWAIVPPTPTITSSPSNPTASTSASFAYNDTQAGVTFKCSLDGVSASTSASSGVTYTDLVQGAHTFAVEAQQGSGPLSSSATATWTVDTSPPSIGLTFPIKSGAYNAPAWAAGCSPVGVCGTASDPSGVAKWPSESSRSRAASTGTARRSRPTP